MDEEVWWCLNGGGGGGGELSVALFVFYVRSVWRRGGGEEEGTRIGIEANIYACSGFCVRGWTGGGIT